MSYIRLVNVTKRFGNVTAVDNLNFEIGKGECFSMLGPSGCGKTTTLRMVAGFEDLSDGEVWVGDRLLSSPVIREKYGLLSVHGNIFDVAGYRKVDDGFILTLDLKYRYYPERPVVEMFPVAGTLPVKVSFHIRYNTPVRQDTVLKEEISLAVANTVPQFYRRQLKRAVREGKIPE